MANSIALNNDETKIVASFLMETVLGTGDWSSAFASFSAVDGTLIWAATNGTTLNNDQPGK